MFFKAVSQVQLHNSPIYALSRYGEVVFSASSDGTIKKYNLTTLQLDPFTVRTSHACISLHTMNNGWLCLGLLNGDFHIIDTLNQQEIFCYSFGDKGVFSVNSNDEYNHIYIGLSSGQWAVLDAGTMELLSLNHASNDKIRRVFWSHVYQKVVLVSKDGSISMLNPINFQLEYSWVAHATGVNCAVFTEEGRCISAGKDGYVRIWSKRDFLLEHAFPAHRGVIYDLLLLDGYLISGSRDRTLKIWNISDYSPVQKLSSHRQSVNALVQQNQQSFVSASDDGSLILWNRD